MSSVDGKTTIHAAAQVMEFCLRHGSSGRALFIGWPNRTLFIYCFFHLAQRTCFTCRARGKISAVMFGWGMPVHEIIGRRARGEPLFSWRVSDDEVDGIFIAEVIVAGSRERGIRSRKRLLDLAMKRWPAWRRKRIFTCRKGRLHEIHRDVAERLIRD